MQKTAYLGREAETSGVVSLASAYPVVTPQKMNEPIKKICYISNGW